MPVVNTSIGVRGNVSDNKDSQATGASTQPGTSNTVLWVVAAVIGGIIVVGTLITCSLTFYAKRRQYRKDKELYPYLTHSQVNERRKKDKFDFFNDEEQRRKHIIRKSLATRSSNTGETGMALTAIMDQIDRELAEIDRQEAPKLKDDWKEWEARVRNERSMSGERHPASIDSTVSTLSAVSASSDVPILEVPTPAKHRSNGRVSFTGSSPSPPLSSHLPGR
jgi:hypothetical protein